MKEFWAEQHGQACVRAAHLTWGATPGSPTATGRRWRKTTNTFLNLVSGESLSRVFCVASTRCLYLRRRVKQYHQVVKGRDAKTFEKFSWGHTALVPLPSEWTATAWMSNCYWSGINNDSCNAKVSQMNIHVIIKKISRDVLCICRVSCSEELRTGQKCLRILH